MRLIERESQLAALYQYADEASQGHGRLVLISGEAGVGKSVLLEEFAQGLEDARWLWAVCDGLFTPAALGPLLDIASQLDGELLRLCRAEARRDQLYGALLGQLDDLESLTVLAIEDVHWADEATLDLLSYLGRRIQHLRVLLLVTYRDDALAVDDPLRLTLGTLASQRATRRLSLATLSVGGVGILAQGSGIDAAELHQLTAGNPFFVTEVVQAGSDALPASVRDAVLARTRTLETQARDALEVAALIGSRMQSELLVTLIDDPLIMDELISRSLLIKDGDDLRFRHEIARVAVEAAIPPYRKASIHTKIMDALLSSGSDDDARLAFHGEGAGRTDLVLWYGSRAGRRASELWAHREAAAQYGRALRAALSGDHEEQAGRVFALMYLMYSTDLRHGEGEQCYTQAVAYCEEHDIGTFAVCLQGERTAYLEKIGRWDECVSLADALLYRYTLSPWNRLKPLCSMAKVMARRGQEGFWPYLDEGIESAMRLGEPDWIVPVGMARTEAYWLGGHLDAAISELGRVRDVAAGLPVAQRAWVALWNRRLTGITDAIDLEPFASQLAGNAPHAAELWDRLGYGYEAALALLDTKDEALLRESLTRLTDLGAVAAARLVRRTMRELGIRSIPTGARTAARTHPRGLTKREQEILELLSEGQSNEKISATLFISVRTVEHHVSAILSKLGASTRKGAAKEARRLSLSRFDRLSATTKSR